jgi:alkyl hydroperoxide reductase subunit AhpC
LEPPEELDLDLHGVPRTLSLGLERAQRGARTGRHDHGVRTKHAASKEKWAGERSGNARCLESPAFATDGRRGLEPKEIIMSLRINDIAPDFTANTTQGEITFHSWLGGAWGILFSHPKDFTPVCTTELGYVAKLKPEFDKRGVKVIGLSVDAVDKHNGWASDIEETQGVAPNFPMIGDPSLAVSKLYDMLPAEAAGEASGRTAADNQTVRTVYVIGPDKKIKLMIAYPMTTGRNFDEILRVIDSMQLTAKHRVATPVNWKQGEDVIIVPAVSNDEAKILYPNGWKQVKPYLRIVAQPGKASGEGTAQ